MWALSFVVWQAFVLQCKTPSEGFIQPSTFCGGDGAWGVVGVNVPCLGRSSLPCLPMEFCQMGSCHPYRELHFTVESAIPVLGCSCRAAPWYHVWAAPRIYKSQLLWATSLRTLLTSIEKYIISFILKKKLLERGQFKVWRLFLLEAKSNVCYLPAPDEFASGDGLHWPGVTLRTFLTSVRNIPCPKMGLLKPTCLHRQQFRSGVPKERLCPCSDAFLSLLRLCQFWHETSKLVFTHCCLSRLTLGVPAAERVFQGQMGSQTTSKGLYLLKIRTQSQMSFSRPFCQHLCCTAVTKHRARHWGPPGDGDIEPSLKGNHGQGEEIDK